MNLKLQSKSRMLYAFLMALISVWGWGQTTTVTLPHTRTTWNSTPDGWIDTPLDSYTTSFACSTNNGAKFDTSGDSKIVRFDSAPDKMSFVVKSNSNNTTSTLLVEQSADGTNYTELISLNGGSSLPTTCTTKGDYQLDPNTRYVKWSFTKGSSNLTMDDVAITKLAVISPSLSFNGTLADFSYVENNGPSANQLLTVSGVNLDNSVVVISATNSSEFEVSLDGNAFAATQNISYSNGAFTDQNVYVRLKSGLSVGTYTGSISVSGGSANTASVNVDGSVDPMPVAPTVSASSFTGTVGASFNDNIQATQNPTSYALVSGNLPLGLNLNTTTGMISGTPNSAGTFTANVTATNNAGTSAPATVTFTIAKGDQTITGFADQTKFFSDPAFTLPVNTNADLAITYSSSDTSVATVSGNTVTVAGLGTTTITATQAGNNDWNALSEQIVLTIAPDPITYNGVGRFEKISSLSDLTDGYYVLVGNDTNAMSTTLASSKFVPSTVSVNNSIITNPSTNIVWNIQTDAGNVKTIFNEQVNRYVSAGGGNTNVSLANSVSGGSQKWEANAVSDLFRFINGNQSGRALWYNGSVFGQYSTTNTSGYYDLALFKRIENTIWNGTSWSNGTPQGKDVEITGVYTTSSNPAFTARNITIKNGGSLEITNANTIAAENITVEDGGNLIQRDGSMLNYSGTFNVLKNTTTAVDKYAFWSSPVAGQNLASIYDGASAPFLITEYSTATNQYVNSTDAAAVAGKGYSIKRPAGNGTLTFTGTPHNELINTYILNNAASGFNLVGNPYPSDLSLPAFYAANSSNISSTFYFWDSSSPAVTSPTGASTTNYGYATYNAAGSPTWVAAPNLGAVSPTGNVAKIGQAFIVKATASNALVLNNSMRGAEAGSFFNKNNSSTEGKFWLQLSTSYNANNTFAVTYSNGASNALDAYDSKAMGTGSNAFYTIADNNRLVIQGRSSFNTNDVVPVGTKHFEAGDFVISLVQKEGLFNNGQPIYLHDKQLNTYTDLQNATYSFSAGAGEFANRFELVYTMGVLSTTEADKNAFEVYRDGNQFVVRNAKKIENVEVYDAAGRKILQISPNATTAVLNLEAKGAYILKAVSNGKTYSQKIIK